MFNGLTFKDLIEQICKDNRYMLSTYCGGKLLNVYNISNGKSTVLLGSKFPFNNECSCMIASSKTSWSSILKANKYNIIDYTYYSESSEINEDELTFPAMLSTDIQTHSDKGVYFVSDLNSLYRYITYESSLYDKYGICVSHSCDLSNVTGLLVLNGEILTTYDIKLKTNSMGNKLYESGIDVKDCNNSLKYLALKVANTLKLNYCLIVLVKDGDTYKVLDIDTSPLMLNFYKDAKVLKVLYSCYSKMIKALVG